MGLPPSLVRGETRRWLLDLVRYCGWRPLMHTLGRRGHQTVLLRSSRPFLMGKDDARSRRLRGCFYQGHARCRNAMVGCAV